MGFQAKPRAMERNGLGMKQKMLPISIIMNPDEPHIVIWYKNKRFNMHVLQSQTDKKNQAAVRGRTSEENIFAIY
jgi:hypothetical protein